MTEPLQCRPGCGACCIAPSISSAIPGHPAGKPAGVRCANLDASNRCVLWNSPSYPAVCRGFAPRWDSCGRDNAHALALLNAMELATAPRRLTSAVHPGVL